MSLVDCFYDRIALSGLLGGNKANQLVAWLLSNGVLDIYPALLEKVTKYAYAEEVFKGVVPKVLTYHLDHDQEL